MGLVLGLAHLFGLAQTMLPERGAGFYASLSHGLMGAIFAPAFVLPLGALAVSLRRSWQSVGGGRATLADLWSTTRAAGPMTHLRGGHCDGCTFEDEGRFSHARRHFHQATLYGVLLCFASTASGSVLHIGSG